MLSQIMSTWRPVALARDLPVASAMPVRLSDETIALWRSASGRLAAWDDRCPHRGMRLSHGFVRGEALSCIYHGWRYGQDGQCLRIPAHPDLEPPKTIRVKSYPVSEQDGLIWVGANEETGGEPPCLDGLMPVRTITIAAGIAAIETSAGTDMAADGILQTESLCLLLSAESETQTLAHVLVPTATTPEGEIAASRRAEALRRQTEARGVQGAAA